MARWNAFATLADGGESYRNRGVHVVRLQLFKIRDMDVYQGTALLGAALDGQAAAGLDEASALQLTS